jgi:hypothetical protein
MVCREYERDEPISRSTVTTPNSDFVPTNGIRAGERLKSDFKEGLVGEQDGREGVLRWFCAVAGQAAVGLWVSVLYGPIGTARATGTPRFPCPMANHRIVTIVGDSYDLFFIKLTYTGR